MIYEEVRRKNRLEIEAHEAKENIKLSLRWIIGIVVTLVLWLKIYQPLFMNYVFEGDDHGGVSYIVSFLSLIPTAGLIIFLIWIIPQIKKAYLDK